MRLLLWLLPFFVLFGKEGLFYTHNEDFPSVHILEIDPDQYKIVPVRATPEQEGKQSVLSFCKTHGAIAGINGGFFKENGDPAGALKIKEWHALPQKPRGCIGWSKKSQNPKIDRILAKIYALRDLKPVCVDGLNRERKKGEAILYTPVFRKTSFTPSNGEEIIIANEQIIAIQKKGNADIPFNGCVLSIEETNPLFGSFHVGMSFQYRIEIQPQTYATSAFEWTLLDYVVGGCPLLLSNQRKLWDFEFEQITVPTFITDTHARTAIGILPNGHWVFVVVEQDDDLDGMTLIDLASYMESLGCTDALNLDGGSSSTLVLEGKIKNSTGGKPVSDAILIFRQ